VRIVPRTITISDEVYEKLESLSKLFEKILGKKTSINEVLEFLISMRTEYFEGLIYSIVKRVDKLEREVSELKKTIGVKRELPKPRHDRFVEFMKDVVVYPMDKIKVSRERIEKLVFDGILDVIHAAGKAYLVYKPKLEEFLNKLPLPVDDVKKLSKEEAKLLELLKNAALVYHDAATKTIRKVI